MPKARDVLNFFLTFLLAFLLVLLTPHCIHRRAYTAAWLAYYKNPTPENAQVLSTQQGINARISVAFSAVGGAIIAVTGYGIYGMIGIVRRVFGPDREAGSTPIS